jgi:hypothetical protein
VANKPRTRIITSLAPTVLFGPPYNALVKLLFRIHSFELCGEHEFAKRLKEANIISYKVSQALSVCTSERFDAAKMMEDSLRQAADQAASLRITCDPEIRRMLESRRAILENMINQIAAQPNLVYDRLGIAVDGDGNIRDK